jgi:predicted ATPase
MFTRCYADNYRCFSSLELPLAPLSVVMGANGSGKSTLLALLSKLRDLILGRGTSLDLFPSETLTRWDRRTEQTFELALRLESGQYVYRLRLSHVPERALNKIMEETLTLDGRLLYTANDQQITLYNDSFGGGVNLMPDWHASGIARIYERNDNKKLWAFRRFVENTLVLALNPALISAVSSEKQAVLLPKPDCSDFAGWLRYITTAEGLARQEVEQGLANGALPGFRAFQAVPSGDAQILQCVFQGSPPIKFRLDELSSGQIALVVLETVMAVARERRGAVLLDEPGNFLGLGEVRPLLGRLQDAALEGQFQVILSAHHPIAVDFLAAGHGRWFDREPSGPTRVKPIEVQEGLQAGNGGIRVSDLIARGWLSGLGVGPEAAASRAPGSP